MPGYVLDGAVEIGSESADDQRVFQAASPILFSDEQNVFEETAAYDLPAERVALAVLEIAFADPSPRRRFLASDTHTATLPRQAAHASHITAFAVVGVHTFVRDGRLTTAGLRGSRVTELIHGLAALNQVQPDVRALSTPGAAAGG